MKWTISKKLGGLSLLMIAVLFAFGVIAYRNITKSIDNSAMVKHTFKLLDVSGDIPIYLWECESASRGFFLTGNKMYYEQYQEARRELTKTLDETKKLVTDEKGRQLMASLETMVNAKLNSFDEVHKAYREKQMAGAIGYISSGKPIKISMDIVKLEKELDQLERDLLKEFEKELNASNSTLFNLVLFGIPLTILLIGLISYLLIRNITVPLRGLTQTAEMISRGELSQKITLEERGDEIGLLNGSFSRMSDYLKGMAQVADSLANNDVTVRCAPSSPHDILGNAFVAMIANLRSMTQEIRDVSSLISSSAAQIAAMTSQLASSSAETAAAVNETSTTVEEIKVTAQLVNNKSAFVAESAQETAQITVAGLKSVGETMNGMDKIRRQMDFIAESVVKLSEQSMAIGEIISSVNDLAGQSNLLAVNASIEAAKAGEQGKGFAVVAQEVRSLAEKSKEATEQVRRILNDIQKAISSAVMATEQGGKTVEAGVRQTTETEGSIQAIEQGVSGTFQAAAQILASTNEQVAGLNQVGQAMDSIRSASDQIVQSSRLAEQSTSALNEMGKKLWQLVERFKVS